MSRQLSSIFVDDTDISAYVIINMVELFGAIRETMFNIYLDTVKSSYVIIMTSEPDYIVLDTQETSEGVVVDIIFTRIEGAMC